MSANLHLEPNSTTSVDAANNAALLRELAQVNDDRRQARFVCVISAAKDGMKWPASEVRRKAFCCMPLGGSSGFGYDPLFFFPPLAKTFAELTPERKAAVSHRGQALRAFLEWCAACRRLRSRVQTPFSPAGRPCVTGGTQLCLSRHLRLAAIGVKFVDIRIRGTRFISSI